MTLLWYAQRARFEAVINVTHFLLVKIFTLFFFRRYFVSVVCAPSRHRQCNTLARVLLLQRFFLYSLRVRSNSCSSILLSYSLFPFQVYQFYSERYISTFCLVSTHSSFLIYFTRTHKCARSPRRARAIALRLVSALLFYFYSRTRELRANDNV